MQYYPDVDNYDMSFPGGMALYLAHCDLDPLLGLIEKTEVELTTSIEYYNSLALKANDNRDFFAQSKYADLTTIFQSRIVPLSYESIILILMSLVEEAFKTWCRIVKNSDPSIPELKDFRCSKHGDLDKTIAYLEEYANIRGIKTDPLWDYITTICIIRNAIVHNGGRIKDDKQQRKLDRYNFGLFPEDNRIYLEIETIQNIYNMVIEFIDRVFLIKPADEGQ